MEKCFKCFLVMIGVANANAAPLSETAMVAKQMHAVWDKPHQPLGLPVIVVHHGFAIVDWHQGEKGGRALLKYHPVHQQWQPLLCGGAALTATKQLQAVGMSRADARVLAQLLQQQETRLTEEQRERIDRFHGVMPLSNAQQGSPIAHSMHGERHDHASAQD